MYNVQCTIIERCSYKLYIIHWKLFINEKPPTRLARGFRLIRNSTKLLGDEGNSSKGRLSEHWLDSDE